MCASSNVSNVWVSSDVLLKPLEAQVGATEACEGTRWLPRSSLAARARRPADPPRLSPTRRPAALLAECWKTAMFDPRRREPLEQRRLVKVLHLVCVATSWLAILSVASVRRPPTVHTAFVLNAILDDPSPRSLAPSPSRRALVKFFKGLPTSQRRRAARLPGLCASWQ